jgi:leucyl-tRNA synthetase
VPVWVGNYVLMGYGDGAVMGVPAHDERDFAFAKKYGIDILQVIHIDGEDFSYDRWHDWYADKQQRHHHQFSGNYSGLATSRRWMPLPPRCRPRAWARRRPPGACATGASAASATGARPSPSSTATACGSVPVPEADLPVVLPEDLVPDGSGNPLNKCASFLNVACPQCGKPARRETDTMDTFVDSSWYYMRYCCPGSDDAMVDARNDYWMPMDQYIGGIEHAVLHLLYARFWTKAMRDLGLVKFGEPFTKLFTQGMLLNESYYREDVGGKKRWFYPSRSGGPATTTGAPTGAVAKADGQPVVLGGIEKMSKSKNNVVEPSDIIAKFGADTARAVHHVRRPARPERGLVRQRRRRLVRFLRRLWGAGRQTGPRLATAGAVGAGPEPAAATLRREMHLLLRQVSTDYDRLQYNTVVSGAMKMLNAIDDAKLHRHAGRQRRAARSLRHPAAHAVPGGAARGPRAVGGTGLCGTPGRADRRTPWPDGGRGRAGAGRDRTRAAGQRQDCAAPSACRPAPTARPSKPPRWPRPNSCVLPTARRPRR